VTIDITNTVILPASSVAIQFALSSPKVALASISLTDVAQPQIEGLQRFVPDGFFEEGIDPIELTLRW
jgi:hypothetical protein